jgi:hypothetical protein
MLKLFFVGPGGKKTAPRDPKRGKERMTTTTQSFTKKNIASLKNK